MRIQFVGSVLLSMAVLYGCGGESETANTLPTSPPGAALPVAPPLLVNSRVDCGDWQQNLNEFKPPYLLRNQKKWVVMGSSSAFGAGASSYAESWAGQLQPVAAEFGAEVINIARGGYTTYHALSDQCTVSSDRPQPDNAHNVDLAVALGADLVIVSFPSNDAASNYSAEETAYNLLAIRTVLAAEQIPLLVLGAQPRNMATTKQQLLLALDNLLKPRFSPCLVELYPLLVDNAGNLAGQYDSGDGVHLNNAGHKLILERLTAAILQPGAAGCFE